MTVDSEVLMSLFLFVPDHSGLVGENRDLFEEEEEEEEDNDDDENDALWFRTA